MSTNAQRETPSKTGITIHINDKPYHVDRSEMTGAEIKTLGGIPPQNRLFREVPGPGDDIAIADGDTVELKSGEKFYDLPVGVHGAPTLAEAPLPANCASVDCVLISSSDNAGARSD